MAIRETPKKLPDWWAFCEGKAHNSHNSGLECRQVAGWSRKRSEVKSSVRGQTQHDHKPAKRSSKQSWNTVQVLHAIEENKCDKWYGVKSDVFQHFCSFNVIFFLRGAPRQHALSPWLDLPSKTQTVINPLMEHRSVSWQRIFFRPSHQPRGPGMHPRKHFTLYSFSKLQPKWQKCRFNILFTSAA